MRNLFTAIVSLSLFIFSGCATTNSERSEKSQEVISTMDVAIEQLNQLTNQLNETEKSLENISNVSDSNLEETFSSFKDNISKLSDLREDLNNTLNDIRSSTNQYLSDWQDDGESYNSEQLRRSSQDRRQELNETFSEVMNDGGDVNRLLEQYIADVNEIESYLSNDLTVSGAKSVSSSRRTVTDTGDELRDAISTMEQSLAEVKQEMGSDINESTESKR